MVRTNRQRPGGLNEDVTPMPGEVDLMAIVLEGRHGEHARAVADFFVEANTQNGDAPRAWAWLGVVQRLQERAEARIGGRKV